MNLESKIIQDEITEKISNNFDFEFNGSTYFEVPKIPEIPKNFKLGLIVGASGSGKSTILKNFGQENVPVWDAQKAICSHFDNADEAQTRLSAVGLNSIPVWLKPYHVLSTGEKFRADLARNLFSNSVIDEFTSVIDRNVAKACSYALRRFVDKNDVNNIVMASCHYDIIEWLQPDWVFDTNTGKLSSRGSESRPTINIEILPCSSSIWSYFSKHHYLSGNINKSSRCWVAVWDGVIVGFVATLAFPSGSVKNAWRGHRTVVLPDFQGLGIGVRISDAVAQILKSCGCRYFSKTSHPRMGMYRENSKLWTATSKNKKSRNDYLSNRKTKEQKHKKLHSHRVCYSHEYVGDTHEIYLSQAG